MSDIIGFDIKPTEESSLMDFLTYGLHKHLEKLEEIGAAAAKEHQLEKTLSKMKEDWKDMKFELTEYRDSVIRIVYYYFYYCYYKVRFY